MADTTAEVRIVPANAASWEDLQAVLGTRGDPSRCQCQRYKMQPKESWASVGAEELAFRFRQQTDCGHPQSGTTSGLVAYLAGEPVGCCARRASRGRGERRTRPTTPSGLSPASSPAPASGAAGSAVRLRAGPST